jgi:hypothetical protein
LFNGLDDSADGSEAFNVDNLCSEFFSSIRIR